MVKTSIGVFFAVSILVGGTLLYFGHVLFATVFWISDVAVFISARTSKDRDREKAYWTSLLVTSGLSVLLIHYVFRGALDWSGFQTWAAVQAVHLSGGGEVLLGFSVCVVLVAIIFRKVKRLDD